MRATGSHSTWDLMKQSHFYIFTVKVTVNCVLDRLKRSGRSLHRSFCFSCYDDGNTTTFVHKGLQNQQNMKVLFQQFSTESDPLPHPYTTCLSFILFRSAGAITAHPFNVPSEMLDCNRTIQTMLSAATSNILDVKWEAITFETIPLFHLPHTPFVCGYFVRTTLTFPAKRSIAATQEWTVGQTRHLATDRTQITGLILVET